MAVILTPHPVLKEVVCSECGLAWELHGEHPSLAECVRLLKAELEQAERERAQAGESRPTRISDTPTGQKRIAEITSTGFYGGRVAETPQVTTWRQQYNERGFAEWR